MIRHLGVLASAFIIIFMFSSHAAADGKAWPAVAYPDVPNIPAQRAMIIFRDGVETLIVESTMETPSPEIGWVLPLPVEPTKLDVADPGLLTSLAYGQSPSITARQEGFGQIPLLAITFVIPAILVMVFGEKERRSWMFLEYSWRPSPVGPVTFAGVGRIHPSQTPPTKTQDSGNSNSHIRCAGPCGLGCGHYAYHRIHHYGTTWRLLGPLRGAGTQ